MKKTFVFLSLLLVASTISAGDLSIITGIWNKNNKTAVKLFRVDHGAPVEVASYQLRPDNKFSFAFYPEHEAFYVIGQNTANAINNYTFYFKPGDQLNVTINNDNSYLLTGKNTPENMELARWHNVIAPLETKAVYFKNENSTYVDFFPLLEEKLKESASFRPEYTKNKPFNEAFKALREYDVLNNALHYLRVPRSAHPQDEDFPHWYRNISVANFTASGRLMDYPYGRMILSAYPIFSILINKATDDGEKKSILAPSKMFNLIIDNTTDVIVQGEAALLLAQTLKSYEGYLSFEENYGKYITTEYQKQRLSEIMLKVTANDKGQTAVDFKFPDRSGKEISLSDFKGKVVYIDIWATWCGPCKEQIPYLKTLEKEYHGKDVVFLGVSTDNQKDYEKWLKFIDDNELKGIQLFAGDKKDDITKPYRVTGIPRFILVGKDGKLISADAPRPFSPEIRLALDAALKNDKP